MKISIVITAWNVEKYIEKAIKSCLNQTYKDLEIIIVEDCSTDSTKEILKKLYPGDIRLRLVENKKNVGAGMSRRIGIQKSTGEYVLLLDGDDWIDPDFIEKLAKSAEETDADIVSGGIIVRHPDGAYDATSYGNTVCEGIEKVTKFWKERIVFMNNKLIRKSLHDQVPYCHRRFIEDTPVIIPQLYLANKVVYVDCIGYNYRMQPESLTHKASPFKFALYRCLCAQDIIKFFEEHDKEYLKEIPIAKQYAAQVSQLKQLKPTPEMVEEFKEDWIDFTCRLISGN